MRKPTEPDRPLRPYLCEPQSQVRELVQDISGEYADLPVFPEVTIAYITLWAKENGIADPGAVRVQFVPGAHEMELWMEDGGGARGLP